MMNRFRALMHSTLDSRKAQEAASQVVHPIFAKYPKWQGTLPSGFMTNWSGALVRSSFYPAQLTEHLPKSSFAGPHSPIADEEIFEWIDVLEAIDQASGSFSMMEVGAGFGRWAVSAAVMLRRWRPMACKLIAIEAEPTHFQMLGDHLRDNGFITEDHLLIEAAVNATGLPVQFVTGHAETWYGQAIVEGDFKDPAFPDARTIELPAIKLSSVLSDFHFIDLCDMDIQGAEAEVVEESIELLSERVRRLHIGTHGHEIEKRLRSVLSEAGWSCSRHYACNSSVETEFGPISFVDGVQSWQNPRLGAGRTVAAPQFATAQPPSPKDASAPIEIVEEGSFRAASPDATVEHTKEGILISGPAVPWGYAAAVNLHPSLTLRRSFVIEVDIEVMAGTIFVTLADNDLGTLGTQKAAAARPGLQRINIFGSRNEGRFVLLFRNGPEATPASARIAAIRASE